MSIRIQAVQLKPESHSVDMAYNITHNILLCVEMWDTCIKNRSELLIRQLLCSSCVQVWWDATSKLTYFICFVLFQLHYWTLGLMFTAGTMKNESLCFCFNSASFSKESIVSYPGTWLRVFVAAVSQLVIKHHNKMATQWLQHLFLYIHCIKRQIKYQCFYFLSLIQNWVFVSISFRFPHILFLIYYFNGSEFKHVCFSMCSSSLSLGVQLVDRPHGGLEMSLYLLSSWCFTCRSVLQGDSLALAWMNTSTHLCCVHYLTALILCTRWWTLNCVSDVLNVIFR